MQINTEIGHMAEYLNNSHKTTENRGTAGPWANSIYIRYELAPLLLINFRFELDVCDGRERGTVPVGCFNCKWIATLGVVMYEVSQTRVCKLGKNNEAL